MMTDPLSVPIVSIVKVVPYRIILFKKMNPGSKLKAVTLFPLIVSAKTNVLFITLPLAFEIYRL